MSGPLEEPVECAGGAAVPHLACNDYDHGFCEKTVYFTLPFKQQYYNTLASFMSITTLSLLWPLLVPVLIQHPLAIHIFCKETTTKMRMEPGADPQLRIREGLL